MRDRASRVASVLGCAAAACWGAYGQTSANTGAARPPPDIGDEVRVEGHHVAVLRAEIQHAEQVLYDRFNAINSSDDFDITCDYQVQTGSKMPRRVCRAKFWGVAQARAAHEGVLRQQGTASAGSAQFEGEARGKQEQLAAEMRRLVATDKELGLAAFRLGELQIALKQELDRSGRPAPTSGEDRSPAPSIRDVPLDAAVSHVEIRGNKSWERALQRRTFSITNPSDKLRSIEVRCRGRTERLQWEEGVEWRLPDDWQDCGLRVEARAGTTFTLYEFE